MKERPPIDVTSDLSVSERTQDDDSTGSGGDLDLLSLYLTVFRGADLGRSFPLKRHLTTIGRSSTADVSLHDYRASRAHCSIEQAHGKLFLVDEGSRNGTFVDGVRVERVELTMSSRIRIGRTHLRVELKSPSEILRDEALFEAATVDALTKILNRRAFHQHAKREMAYARRHDTGLAAIMADVDHFKNINDVYGHLVGDQVLVELAAIFRQALRVEDLLCRYGGEEFLVVTRAASIGEGLVLAERLLQAVRAQRFLFEGEEMAVTVSFGVAALIPGEDIDELIGRADRALYKAKTRGRNRVEDA